jgi:hypothetical protein
MIAHGDFVRPRDEIAIGRGMSAMMWKWLFLALALVQRSRFLGSREGVLIRFWQEVIGHLPFSGPDCVTIGRGGGNPAL